MNPAHFHLLANHLPVMGSFLGAFVLAYGLFVNSPKTKVAAYFILIFSAIGAVFTFLSGEGAEEIIEKMNEFSESTIEKHENTAKVSLIVFITLGVLSIFGIFQDVMKKTVSKALAKLILFISLIAFGLVAVTAYNGGQIRHSELNGSSVSDENSEYTREAHEH